MIKKKFKIEGMDCVSCALNIDMELEELQGVKSTNTNYAKSELEIEFDPEKVDEKLILEAIKKLGFTATL